MQPSQVSVVPAKHRQKASICLMQAIEKDFITFPFMFIRIATHTERWRRWLLVEITLISHILQLFVKFFLRSLFVTPILGCFPAGFCLHTVVNCDQEDVGNCVKKRVSKRETKKQHFS